METWLGRLAGLAALVIFASTTIAQTDNQDRQIKQVKLSEKQVKDFLSAQKQLVPLAPKLEGNSDKPDPSLQQQVEKIAKSNGFASLQDFEDVGANISLVLSGLNPETGQYTEPPDQIRNEIEELAKDQQVPKEEKDKIRAELEAALKTAPPLEFKENVAVVAKFQKDFAQLAQDVEARLPEASK